MHGQYADLILIIIRVLVLCGKRTLYTSSFMTQISDTHFRFANVFARVTSGVLVVSRTHTFAVHVNIYSVECALRSALHRRTHKL